MNKRKLATTLLLSLCTLTGVTACKDSHTHDYKETVVNEATCNTVGLSNFICDCGNNYMQNVNLTSLSANEVFESSKNSVGEITTYDKDGSELALGTGFTYSADGKIVTNYHVIEDAYSIKVFIMNNTYTVQSILAYDKNKDLAVLQITASNLPVLTICTASHGVGKTVYALGSSRGLTETFSTGSITTADRELDGVHYVQHDASISSGNSGGPLINEYGEIIGINTMTITESQNLNFAISVKELSSLTYGTPLTVAEFYEKESDTYTKLKNYLIKKGTYDSEDNEYELTLGTTYSSDYTSIYTRKAYYDIADDKISLSLFINSDHLLSIYISAADGVYTWSYINSDSYYMKGTLYAITYTEDTLLGYSYCSTTNSTLKSTMRELASAMTNLLLSYLDSDFSSINVTISDLGFLLF